MWMKNKDAELTIGLFIVQQRWSSILNDYDRVHVVFNNVFQDSKVYK